MMVLEHECMHCSDECYGCCICSPENCHKVLNKERDYRRIGLSMFSRFPYREDTPFETEVLEKLDKLISILTNDSGGGGIR